jgi:hypothetical protein
MRENNPMCHWQSSPSGQDLIATLTVNPELGRSSRRVAVADVRFRNRRADPEERIPVPG